VNVVSAPRATRGQALTEFAIVLPVLFLILAAILQFGLILSSQIGITNSVREAARYGSVLSVTDSSGASSTATQVLTYLQGGGTCSTTAGLLSTNVHPFLCASSDTLPGLGPSSAGVSYCAYQNPGTGSATAGEYSVRIAVTVSYNHPLYLPVIANIIDALDGSNTPGSFRLTASEQMRVENAPLSQEQVSSLPACSS
jgi:Flp pilus assembly protein TadG